MSLPLRIPPEIKAQAEAEFAARCELWNRELSASEQLALMTARRSDLCREVVDKLKTSTVRSSAADEHFLIQRHYLARQGSRLIVTPQGKRRADDIAWQAARELGIHFFVTGSDRLHNHIRCSCGWSHCYTASFHHVARCNAEWMARHLREVGEQKASVVAGATTQAQHQGESADASR